MSANNNNNNSNMPRGIGGGGASPGTFGNQGLVSHSVTGNPMYQHSQQQRQYGNAFQNQQSLQQQQQLQIAHANALVQAQLKTQAQNNMQVQVARAQYQAQLQAQQGMTLNQAQAYGIGNLGGGSSSPSLSAVGNASAKRLPQKPPIVTTNVSAMKTLEINRRKKQKLLEKQFQDRIAASLPESAMYTQLLEFESGVDVSLARKRFDLQEAVKDPPSIQRTLRIYVFNTFANQIRTIPSKPNEEPPSWTLKIVGKILEDGVDPDQPGAMQNSTAFSPKFSYFFKGVKISLDPKLYPDKPIIIWENTQSASPLEGFEVTRPGDTEFTAKIHLEMKYTPEKFKLSLPLMEVLGVEVDTNQRVLAAIWHYIKAWKLQSPHDPLFFMCDAPLQRVFNEEKLKFTDVSKKLSQHLSPAPPIMLEHKIRLSGNSQAGNLCYDVLVDVPFPIQKEVSSILANTEKTKEIDTCNEDIRAIIRKIHEHRKRRAFFLGFSQSPVEFINALIESQNKDLKVVAGEPSRNAEMEQQSDFFNLPWVEDGVIRYLNRQPNGTTDTSGANKS